MVHDESHDESVQESQNERRRGKPAREKIMDLLARRGHSELELRQKLSRFYEEDEVEDAITFARENNWMTPPDELAGRVAAELGRKQKGHRYINQFLKAKGLPVVAKDLDEEVRKGREIAQMKLGKDGPYDYEERKKIYRLLANRGFDDETIRRVLRAEENHR
jgi:regulatory protein